MSGVEVSSRLVSETRILPLPRGGAFLIRGRCPNDIVSMVITAPMGSREEPPEKAGLSTLALRMLSRGTARLSDYELAVALESIGASVATDVQKDRAFVTVQTTTSQWERTLHLAREMLLDPSFPEEEFEVEKEILQSEIREDLDSPYTAAFRLFQKTLFAGRPYAHSTQGTEETIAGITLSDAREYFRGRFSSAPLTVALVGNIDPDQALAGVSEWVENLPEVDPCVARDPGPPTASPDRVEVHEHRATEAECLIEGFHAPGFRDPDYAAWKVLDSITGGSMDSRLFAEIREKLGLVYQIGSSYPALEWSSFFAISLISTRQNHDRILEQLEIEIRKLRETPPDADELARAKTYLKGTFLMSQERNGDQAHMLARYHSLGLGIDFIDRYPRMLDAVTAEQVREVAEESLHSPVVAVVGPGPE